MYFFDTDKRVSQVTKFVSHDFYFSSILLKPEVHILVTFTSTLDVDFKLYTSFLLIVPANDIKFKHSHRLLWAVSI